MELLQGEAGKRAPVGTYAGGYSLLVDRGALPYEGRGVFRFRILGEDGHTVQGFDLRRGGRLHLVVVRQRTLTHFQYLRPSESLDGAWSAPLELTEPGVYRALADFSVVGVRRTLGAELTVLGATQARPVPAPATTASVDGYEISLDAPVLRTGTGNRVAFRIRRPATGSRDPDDELAADASLLALREGDLALLYGRPFGGADETLDYEMAFPGKGRYRLFLRFFDHEVERTAAFTVEVTW